MDSSVPRSKPATITVASDQEPVETRGTYAPTSDGFALEFCLGKDKFVIEHTDAHTKVSAVGELSYCLTVGEDSDMLVRTPFGTMRFFVRSLMRNVDVTDDGVNIFIKYIMSSEATGEQERAVSVSARF